MRRTRTAAALAVTAAASLGLAACGGGSGSSSTTSSNSSSGSGTSGFNAGATNVVNPSTTKGGTLRMAISDDWDSLDPGDTYYGFSWNFARLYTRALTTFAPAPGEAGLK